jgi:hypothetical protein
VPMNGASRSSSARADGGFFSRTGGELEQQPERVPIGRDRVGAHIALAHEPLGEEALDESGKLRAGFMTWPPIAARGGAPPPHQLRAGRQIPMGTSKNTSI